jgi:hypothetical protein
MLIYKKEDVAKFKFFELHLELPEITINKNRMPDVFGDNYYMTKISFPSEYFHARDGRSFYHFKFVIFGIGISIRYQWNY